MISNRDVQLKKERGYHGKSYVRSDGSECLLDRADWELRKRELWDRAQGVCEHICTLWSITEEKYVKRRCFDEGTIPAHVIPRYPRRDDRLSNLKLYCKFHDKQHEKQSWRKTRFGEKGKKVCKRASTRRNAS